MTYFKAKPTEIRSIPDIEGITQLLNVGRLELCGLAGAIARCRKISANSALFLLESGEVNKEQARELLIESLQTKQIQSEPELKLDDTPSQP